MKKRIALVLVFLVIGVTCLFSSIFVLNSKQPLINPLAQSSRILKTVSTFSKSQIIITITATTTPSPTPTPTPLPTPIPVSPEELENLFNKYANEYSIDKNLLKKIASCESNFNPNAEFRDYAGLFQFSKETWITSRSLMGFDSNPDLRFNAEEAIRTASFKIARGELFAWPNCH